MKKYICILVCMILGWSHIYSDDMVTGGFILVSPSQEKGKYWKIEGKTAKFLPDNWLIKQYLTREGNQFEKFFWQVGEYFNLL